jgi:hypothetical protein
MGAPAKRVNQSTSVVTGQPEHFDAVIVGSGFGGAVTAAR